MRHLNPDELLDLVDGRGTGATAGHIGTCAACRTELAELQAMMSAAADVDVPEPSPLFWEHLSTRVRQAVAAEEGSRASGWAGRASDWVERRMSWRFVVPVTAAAVALAVAVAVRMPKAVGDPAAVAVGPSAQAIDEDRAAPLTLLNDDPSLSLVADLAAELDWEATAAAGLMTRAGVVEEAVVDLTAGEQIELQRLLKDALARPGA